MPTRKLTKKQTKHASKPWITTAIRKSLQVRDKILKKFIRLKDKSSRDLLYSKYKQYRNLIVKLIRMSKNNHFKNYFKNNLNNSKKTWEGINDVLNKSNKPS